MHLQIDFYNSLLFCRKSLCYMISIIFCLSLIVQCNATTGSKETQYKSRFTLNTNEESNTSIQYQYQYNQTTSSSLKEWSSQLKFSNHYIFSDESNLPIEFIVNEKEEEDTTTNTDNKEEDKDIKEEKQNQKIGSFQHNNNILYSNLKTRNNNIKLQNQQSFTSPIKDNSLYKGEGNDDNLMNLILSRSYIDFDNVGLCMRSNQILTISNPSEKESIQILSMVSYSPFYYCSDFISSFILGPRTSKSLTITFQPNEIGLLESTFILNTNLGEYSFSVNGQGTRNLYQLSAINQIIIQNQLSTSSNNNKNNQKDETFEYFIYPISIYNPHPSTLRILNIFTNDYPFFLSVPNNWKKIKNDDEYLWDIKPFSKSHIINLYFKSKSIIGNYNGFINIESNFNSFIINVDINILKNDKTLQISQHEIDFGYLCVSPDQLMDHYRNQVSGKNSNSKNSNPLVVKSKKIPLNLVNSDSLTISIKSEDTNQKRTIILNDTLIPAHFESLNEIGNFQWIYSMTLQEQHSNIGRVKEFTGQYIIHFKSNKPVIDEENYYESTLVLQWKVKTLIGELSYSEDDRLFNLIGSNPIDKQQLILKNEFSVPIQIQSLYILRDSYHQKQQNENEEDPQISLIGEKEDEEEQQDIFEIQNVGSLFNKVLFPGEYWNPIHLLYRKLNIDSPFPVSSHSKLIIQSNLSNFEIDLHSFNGNLDVISPQPSTVNNSPEIIDFGIVGVDEHRKKTFLLRNPTPFPLTIQCFQLVNVSKRISSNVDIQLTLEYIYNEKLKIKETGFASNNLISQCSASSSGIVTLAPEYIGSFQIDLSSKVSMKVLELGLKVKSNLSFQIIPIHFNILNGSLKIYPLNIQFDSTELITKPLFAHNTYDVPVNITTIDSSDSKVICNINEITLPPHRAVLFANLIMDSNLIFQNYFNNNGQQKDTNSDSNLLSNNQSIQEFFKREENWMSLNNHYHYYSISSNIKIHTDINDFNIKVNGILKKPELHISDCLLDHSSPKSTIKKENEKEIDTTVYENIGGGGGVLSSSETIPILKSEFDDYFINSNIDFGLVRIGEQSSKYLYIHNPLDVELVAQLLPFNTQFDISNLLLQSESKLSSSLDIIFNLSNDTSIGNSNNNNNGNSFIISNQNTSTKNNQEQSLMNQNLHFEYFNDEIFNEFIKIPPLETFKLGPILFSPKNIYTYSWIIYLKNNYTLLSPIKLTGKGGGGKLVMIPSHSSSEQNSANISSQDLNANSNSNNNEMHTLLFELNKTHLSPCIFKKKDEPDINSEILFDKNQKTIPKSQKDTRIELNKTISIVNRGNIPIEIHDFFINDLKCSGYGFKVQMCNDIRSQGPKLLGPGESFKLTITFEPDFTTSLLKRELVVKTNQRPFYFQLVGSIPHDYLPLCTHLHPSNFYEYHAKIVFIICMLILFIVLVFITFREFSKQQQQQQLQQQQQQQQHQHHHSLQANSRNTNSGSSSGSNSNVSKSNKNIYKFSNHENPNGSFRELVLDDHHHNIHHAPQQQLHNNQPQQEISLQKSPDKSSNTTPVTVNNTTPTSNNSSSTTTIATSSTVVDQSIKNQNPPQKKKKSSPVLPRSINNSSEFDNNDLFEFNIASTANNNIVSSNSVGKVKDYNSITPKKSEPGPPSILKKKSSEDGSSSVIKSVVFADKPIIVNGNGTITNPRKLSINNDKKPVIPSTPLTVIDNPSTSSTPITTNNPISIVEQPANTNTSSIEVVPSKNNIPTASVTPTNNTTPFSNSTPSSTQTEVVPSNSTTTTTTSTSSSTTVVPIKKHPKVFEGKKKYEKYENSTPTTSNQPIATPAPSISNFKNRYHDQQPPHKTTTREPKEYKPKKSFEKPKKVYIPKVKDTNSTTPTPTSNTNPSTSTVSTSNATNINSTNNSVMNNSTTSNNIVQPKPTNSTSSLTSILGNNLTDGFSNFFPFFSTPSTGGSNGYSSFMDMNIKSNGSIDNNPFWKPSNTSGTPTITGPTTDSFKVQQPSIGVIGSGKSIHHHMSSTSPLRDSSGSSPNTPSPLFDFSKEVTPVNHHTQFSFNDMMGISNLYSSIDNNNSSNNSNNNNNTSITNGIVPNSNNTNYFGSLNYSTPTYDLFSSNHSLFTKPTVTPTSSSPSNPAINGIKSNHSPISSPSRSNPPSPTSHLSSN